MFFFFNCIKNLSTLERLVIAPIRILPSFTKTGYVIRSSVLTRVFNIHGSSSLTFNITRLSPSNKICDSLLARFSLKSAINLVTDGPLIWKEVIPNSFSIKMLESI